MTKQYNMGLIKKTQRLLLVFILILLWSVGLNAQPDIIWEKTYGDSLNDWGQSVQQTTDGGYIVVGGTWREMQGPVPQQVFVYLIKTDSSGDTLWTKTYGDYLHNWGYSVQQTTDGGYVIAGHVNPYAGSPMGEAEVYLIKTDSNGDISWTKTYGETDEANYGRSVCQTADGGYAIAGIGTPPGGCNNVLLIKTNEHGDTLWTKSYGDPGTADRGESICQTTDGGYVIVGSSTPFDSNFNDYIDDYIQDEYLLDLAWNVYLIKTDSTGETLWTKKYGAPGRGGGYSVQQTTDDGYIIAGWRVASGGDNANVWLIKTDANGNIEWDSTFGGVNNDIGYSVCQTTEGGYAIAGRTYSYGASDDVWLIKTDANGNIKWDMTLGGVNNDNGRSVCQTADGGYVIAGQTWSYGAGAGDVWLIKAAPEAQDHKLLTEGWNWVSFPVLPDPDGTNALEVLEPILDTLILDKVVFEGKDVIYYEAGGWVNDLTDSNFRSIEGYKIKMKRDAELVISGVREEPETPIPLYAGDRTPEWYPMDYENWIGYFLPYSQSTHDAFANVWDKLTFIKADNYTLIRKWNSDEWWGAVSGPVSVDYGKSYIVGVTEDCTLIWGSGEPTSPYERPKTLVFDYQEQADYMPVFVDSTKALAGIDEIGVFLEDECIGASVVDGYPLFIPAYIEDEDSTGGKDYGELTFQVATYGKGGKRSIQAFVYNPAQNAFVQAPVTLDRDSYAVVRLGTGEGAESPKEFALYQNHPNPVTTSTTISFIPSPGAESSEIKIYNIKGQLIRELEFSPPAGGSDSGFDEATWDGRDAHGRQVANGIYFYKVTSGDKTAVKKMLVLH
jgi:hypothetical protein